MADVTWHEAAAETERSSEEIQQHIVDMEEEISETVDEISHRITGSLDWRHYVSRYPFVAVGVTAGLGFLAAMMLPGPAAAEERICGPAEEDGSQPGRSPSAAERVGAVLPSLGSLAFMIAAGLAQKAVSEAFFGAESAWEASPPGSPSPQPETATVEEMTGNL
ncbi:MAG: hypothetical protein ACOC6L_04090 [Thermodesulfobacteriota bacterium]